MQTIPFHSLYVNCKEYESTDYLEYKKMLEDHLAYSAGQAKKVDARFFEVGAIRTSPHEYISFCIENKQLHLGMYNSKTKELSRNVDFLKLKEALNNVQLARLDTRIQNTIKGTLKLRDPDLLNCWQEELKTIKVENEKNEKYHLSSFDDRIKDAINRVNHNKIDPNVQERREKILSRQSTNPGRD